MAGQKIKSKEIILTMGDPLGIGPEIIIKSLLSLPPELKKQEYIVIGYRPAFERSGDFDRVLKNKNVSFIEIDFDGKLDFTKNPFSEENKKIAGMLSFMALQMACDILMEEPEILLVTAPLCKNHILLCGADFMGHTEYLQHRFQAQNHGMLLASSHMKVLLATTHIPYEDVPKKITPKLITEKLELLSHALSEVFKFKKFRIGVLGLNPHAGENGYIGETEKNIIEPAIKNFKKKNPACDVVGPLSPDTAFISSQRENITAYLCLYHDQGLIPLKTLGFEEGVNITLGLPIIRTSPDHGTAFDIAYMNKADPRSFMRAIHVALELS